jgi:hypothetical protein
MSKLAPTVVQWGRAIDTRFALMLAVLLMTSVLVESYAIASTQPPAFVRTDYQQLGNNHVAGDFNGDGKLDLAGIGAQSVAVMLGNGNGTFGPRVEYPIASWAQDIAAGDFNSDGKLDLVVTINDPQIGLALLTGNGDGTFNAPVSFPNTAHFDSPAIVAADFNNDGRLDIVIGHQIACWTAPCAVARTISVMLGNGDGTFQPARQIDIGTETAKIAVGDFNRDGIKDLAIASSRSRVCILLGVGDGTFIQQPTLTLIAENNLGMDATDVDVADFNGDSREDLVVAVALNGSKTAILIGNGDGTFQAPLLITEPNLNIPHQQAVADLNGDGFQDIALSLGHGNSGLMEILKGNGDGTFQPPVLYLVPPSNSSISGGAIIAADFNGDGKPDIALGITGASPALAVLRNSTGVTPPPTPSAPTLVSPGNDATPSQPVTFDWADVSAAASYQIQIDDSSTFSTPLVVNGTVTVSQFTTSGLAARQHWWRVRGINSAGTPGPWSSVRRFTPRAAAPPPGQTAILTVTATGRSGSRVTSSPAGINVAVGSSGSAAFATGTAITLSATDGRDVVWSGACSSGGSKRKTCTFTLNGNATVNANVQ